MRTYFSWFIQLYCSFFLANTVFANSLTPPNEPRNDSFYVCYKNSRIQSTTYAPLSTFREIHYMGCMIDTRPCSLIYLKQPKCIKTTRIARCVPCTTKNPKNPPEVCKSISKNATCRSNPCKANIKMCQIVSIKREACPPICLKQFGWFNNYPQAMNAFYRCAYS